VGEQLARRTSGELQRTGALGKYVVVFPDRGLVVVYLNHTDYPDDASVIPAGELKKLPNMTRAQMARLLQLLLEAK